MKKFFIFLLIVSSTLHAYDCVRTKILMGTYVTISLNKQECSFSQDGFDLIEKIENSLSSYKTSSVIFKLNKNKYVKLDRFAYEALSLSKKYYRITQGYFDVLIGSITKDLYRFGEDERVATSKELQDADVRFKLLSFNTKEAYLKSQGKVDLGGMGKGYGVEKTIALFKTKKVKKAIVAASGDIRCLGECSVSVQNPYAKGVLASFRTKKYEVGISTSGTYNRYVKNEMHNHLIDPKNKQSEKEFLSVTLISNISSSDLDAYATAVSVMPKEKAYEFLESQGIAYIILQKDGELKLGKQLAKYVKNLVFYDAPAQKPHYKNK